MNVVVLQGNFTKDPELKAFSVGDREAKFLQFTIAVNNSHKKNGEWVNEASFVTCKAWDSGAERIADRFKKGDPILVQGKLLEEKWTDENNNPQSRLVVRVVSFDKLNRFTGNNEQNNEQKPQQQETVAASASIDDDDIPF